MRKSKNINNAKLLGFMIFSVIVPGIIITMRAEQGVIMSQI